jgi:Flp pilus assembly protein TadD
MKPTQGSVAVTPSSPANTNIASDPTPAETRQALEAASNHTLRNDWDGAIRALKQAQKSPGSQSGKIHQDLAYCYQQKGNKATAKTYYEQAISEYEKQIAAGTQKELAESGIKACKRGIKACE